jgi:hypothetical protein
MKGPRAIGAVFELKNEDRLVNRRHQPRALRGAYVAVPTPFRPLQVHLTSYEPTLRARSAWSAVSV